MEYAKVINKEVVQLGLPQTGTLKNGSSVSGYNLLDEAILIDEGWLPFENILPIYDPETQYVEDNGYTITDTKVSVNYIVKTKEVVIPTPSLEERVSAMEEYLMSL